MFLHLLLIALPLFLIYFLRKTKKSVELPVPPGPPALPLIGNLHQLAIANDIHVYLWQLSKKYGPIMQLKLGSIRAIVISSPKLAKYVLKERDLSFCNRPIFLGGRKISYNCSDMVYSPYNDYFIEVRKITNMHLFSPRKNQSFRPIREDEISRMVAKISGFANQVVNLSEVAMATASTLICRLAFAKRLDEKGHEMQRFDELLHEAQALLVTSFVSDYFPRLGWIDKLTGLINRLDSTFGKLDTFYQELIDEHLDSRRVKREDDIVDILIKLKEQKSSSIDLDWHHVKALLTDIFIAGTDTSAASTVWTMTALMKAPCVMKKAQAEIRSLVGNKGKIDEDDLQKLSYLKAVINESFRLYPPAPMLVPRETREKCMLEGYEIQPKTVVYINAWAIARDPEYWKNPEEFLPERFLNSNIDIKGQNFCVIPFGSGRRICPGMFMGIASVELIVANLLYSFDWEFPSGIQAEDVDTDALPGITMHKKNELFLVPKKYNV